MDAEGYGFPAHDRTMARLMADIRVMGPAGVERAAHGWDLHAGIPGLTNFEATEKAATHEIERHDRGGVWDTFRSSLFGLTESGEALESWKVEHGVTGHKAERAAFAAALALVAGDLIGHDQYATLVRPMAEALPWLLPESELLGD